MSAKKINIKNRNEYNLDLIKNNSINHQDLSIKISPPEDIRQINRDSNPKVNNNDLIKSNSSNNSNTLSQNNEEKMSSDGQGEGEGEGGLSDNNYNSDENDNIINSNNENEKCDEEDKINLIKKQNKKIDELFNILESRDKEINTLKDENYLLYKYKNEFEILEKENYKLTNILNKYEQGIGNNEQKMQNLKNKIINYENFSQELEYNYSTLKKENENIKIMNERLNKKINLLKNENQLLKQENMSFFQKMQKLEEKIIFMRNENKKIEKEMKKYNSINYDLNMIIKDREKTIQQLKQESNIQINELKEYQENNINNEKKVLYFQEKNDQIMNELSSINKKENTIKVKITNYLNNFSKQILDMIDQSEMIFQKINNNDSINNNLIIHNGINSSFIIKDEYFNIAKEIPILSKVQLIYDEVKKILNSFLENLSGMKYSFNIKNNNFNNTLKSLNENVVNLTQKLSAEKEKNKLLIKNNQNKSYEINKATYDLNVKNNNNNELSLKLEFINNFIHSTYNNILDKYNEISSKTRTKENNYIKNEINFKKDIKEMITEIEKYFNEMVEYIKFMIKDKNKMNDLEKINIQLKKEKMELLKNINKLQNEINSATVENKNKNENLKIQYDINLKEQIKEIENKNNEIIKQLNEQINLRNEEIIKVNKNYNLLYNQYKHILRNNNNSENI